MFTIALPIPTNILATSPKLATQTAIQPIVTAISSTPSKAIEDRDRAEGNDPSERYVLRLFVSCRQSSTESSLRTLHRVLERSMLQPYTLQVIDISKHPEQVELDQVTATPTLLRVHPLPHRRLVGNLENEDQLLHLLAEMDLNAYH
jgi:circadian clock protein KaiB